MCCKQGWQFSRFIPAHVARKLIELCPVPGVQGNGTDKDTTLLEYATDFAQNPTVFPGVFDDIKGTDEFEFPIAERQVRTVAGLCDSAVCGKLPDRWRADVYEMGFRYRQARVQARADFKAIRGMRH